MAEHELFAQREILVDHGWSLPDLNKARNNRLNRLFELDVIFLEMNNFFFELCQTLGLILSALVQRREVLVKVVEIILLYRQIGKLVVLDF